MVDNIQMSRIILKVTFKILRKQLSEIRKAGETDLSLEEDQVPEHLHNLRQQVSIKKPYIFSQHYIDFDSLFNFVIYQCDFLNL